MIAVARFFANGLQRQLSGERIHTMQLLREGVHGEAGCRLHVAIQELRTAAIFLQRMKAALQLPDHPVGEWPHDEESEQIHERMKQGQCGR